MTRQVKEWAVYLIEVYIYGSIDFATFYKVVAEITRKTKRHSSYSSFSQNRIGFACHSREDAADCLADIYDESYSVNLRVQADLTPFIYRSVLQPFSFREGQLAYYNGKLVQIVSSPGMNHYNVVPPPSTPTSYRVQIHQDNLVPVEYDVRAMISLSCPLADRLQISTATPYGRVMVNPAEFIQYLQDNNFLQFISEIQITRLPPKE